MCIRDSPEDWIDQGFGTSIRDDSSIADQLVLLQQAVPADVDTFLGLFGGQIGAELIEAEEETFGDRAWRVFEGDSDIGSALAWAIEENGTTLVAVLVGNSDIFPDAREHVMPEVLTNLTGP